jgi:hypothetical protein
MQTSMETNLKEKLYLFSRHLSLPSQLYFIRLQLCQIHRTFSLSIIALLAPFNPVKTELFVQDILAQKQQAEKDLQEGLRRAEAALARRLSGLMPSLDASDGGPTLELEAGTMNGAMPEGVTAVHQDGDVGVEARGEERIDGEGNGDERREDGLDGQLGSSVNAQARSGEWVENILEDADEVTDS